MYFEKFNELADTTKARLQSKDSEIETSRELDANMRAEYDREYATGSKKSSEIVQEMVKKYPDHDVLEILREAMDHTRE